MNSRTVDPKSIRLGTFRGGTPDTVRGAGFYTRKTKMEDKLGRSLSLDEFLFIVEDEKNNQIRQTDPGLTWVGGGRNWEDLDDTSRKILAASSSGTSIFDPVLTELCYKWFCPHGGLILDPFAGGSVRGIVASVLGYSYRGHELRAEQIASNVEQAIELEANKSIWIEGDSLKTIPAWSGVADFVFSCPPYGDLEVYSDDASDLSTMQYDKFVLAYQKIIKASCDKLSNDRFAAFIVGDFRDKKGFYRNFVGETVSAFEAAGARFYNDAVLITAVGSLPVRAGRQFKAARKLGKTHQNILVFCKGCPKKATIAINAAIATETPKP